MLKRLVLLITFAAFPSWAQTTISGITTTPIQNILPCYYSGPGSCVTKSEPPKTDLEVAWEVCTNRHWKSSNGTYGSYTWEPEWEDCKRVEDEIERLKNEVVTLMNADRARRDREALNRALRALDERPK